GLDTLVNYLGGILCVGLTVLENEGRELMLCAQSYSEQSYKYRESFEQVGARFELTEMPMSSWVVANGRFLHIPDIAKQPTSRAQTQAAVAAGMCSILYVPLLARSKPIGVLHIEIWSEPRELTPEEMQLCQGVANLVAAVLENGRLLAAERKQLLLAQTLQKMGHLLTSQMSLNELYDQLFLLLAEVLPYDSVSIQLFDKKTESVKLVAAKGFHFSSLDPELSSNIARHSLKKFSSGDQICIIPDTYASDKWVKAAGIEKVRSWIGALLRVKGEVVGILNVDSYSVNMYKQEDGEMVAAFANQAAVAIENTRLYKETDRRATELSILHQLAIETASIVDLDELFTKVTRDISTGSYSENFGFLLVDEQNEMMHLHQSYHGVPIEMQQRAIPLDDSVCGLVFETGKPLIVPDVREAPRYLELSPDMRSEVVVPIKIGADVIGVINVESAALCAFSQSDVVFLTTLAGLISATVARLRVVQQLQAHSDNLEKEVAEQTAELKLERDRTITILEHAGESILLLDGTAKIVYVNEAMVRQSGYSRGELIGKTPLFFKSELTASSDYSEFMSMLLQGKPWMGQMVNKRRDGSFYDVALTMAPVAAAEGEITGFVVVESDITRLKEIERLKTEFVANVTHELRTPLTNVKTYVTLAERGREEQRSRYFQILHHETDRLTQLIQDLLDLSHLETEAPLQDVAPVDLGRIVQQYVDIFQAKAALKDVRLHLVVAEGETAVSVEDKHLGQLLTNLLGNAIAYTPEGGEIMVEVGQSKTAVSPQGWFQITDSGTGIPPEELPYLFDRFYRGSLGQKEGIPGTGLGLAICQGIVNRYQGSIEIASELGIGTTVVVCLPAATVSLEGGSV
ncbi:MAG: GAF domain-containing protein, partial [Anaerolineae bacterium]|nr:GAF domain-containing protein [Anaerolineae bacterium]